MIPNGRDLNYTEICKTEGLNKQTWEHVTGIRINFKTDAMENLANPYFKIAVQKMKEANQELYRPEEDVVSYLVCKNAQIAVQNFLRGYLLRSGIETKKEDTLDTLFTQCKELNKKFENVSLSGLNCQYENKDSRYCDGVEKVSRCFDIADRLDTFLREEKIIA